jgi:glycosidase
MTHDPYQPVSYVKLKHPEWTKNATIYQINTRQFTPEGTFRAAKTHLPRLKDLGVDILWLMPVHEIGIQNRKGRLGSPYSVRDYYSVNSEFGTLDDLKDFVRAAHAQGMYVIFDWVANHTAWDSNLVTEHPEWYARDWKGDLHPTPWWDWEDVIDLDYQNPALRKYMTEALKYWVKEADIDGYRCDVASFIPTDFWNNVRQELDAIKPVFMLAEWESRDLHEYAFDMTYAWTWNYAVRDLVNGKVGMNELFIYYSWNDKAFTQDMLRMTHITNHDLNSWYGTQSEIFGDGLEPAIVLSVVGEGLPLLYNGQEAGDSKRLAFFEKDPIEWKEHPIGHLYKELFALKKSNTALWNARWGAKMIHVANSAPEKVFSFVRQNEHDKVFVALNFSDEIQTVAFKESLFHGSYLDYFRKERMEFSAQSSLVLKPWEYRVFVR